ncbi:MAG: glycosyltransferase [Acidobacteriota bacterium]
MNEPTHDRVAVIHDWLTGMRGGEKVLEAILQLYPAAELFTLFHFQGAVSPFIEKRVIHTSSLQRWAEKIDDYRKLLPLFPFAVQQWSLQNYDLVISSSHCVAKGVSTAAPHVSYCHTPMRYIWDRFDDYFPPERPFTRFAANVVAPFLRRWDQKTAANVDLFVANSAFVRDRIRRHYGREAAVVHPFVDQAFLEPELVESRGDYHLIVSALVPYKRIEMAIEAFRSGERKLIVVGDGPLGDELRDLAGPNVSILGFVSEEELLLLYARALSLILPGVEDFGITCLEAMALGTPVVALRKGGSLDTVVDGETGIFFDEPSVDSLLSAVGRAEQTRWDRGAIRAHANRFSRARFQHELTALIDDVHRQ